MKLLELTIDNVRGIRHLKIKPDGKNFLISGPNGSGKSAVVDSIDFLLTGEISRMKGKGTKGIIQKKHGVHVDAKPNEAKVKALVKLPNIKEPVEIKRSFSSPNKLIYDKSYQPTIMPITELASRGQHILTRREILNFVTADAGTRSSQVQKLLNLESIEDYRKKLHKVRNNSKNYYQAALDSLLLANAVVNNTVDLEDPTEKEVLNVINDHRNVLNGNSLTKLDVSLLKKDLSPPTSFPDSKINHNLLKKDLENLLNITSQDELECKLENLRKLMEKIINNSVLKGAIKRLKLTQMGINLIDETGSCPLCDTSWDPVELKEHLEDNLQKYQEAKKDLSQVEILSNDILKSINRLKSSLDEIKKARIEWELEDAHPELDSWRNELDILGDKLGDLDNEIQFSYYKNLGAPVNLSEIVEQILEVSKMKFIPPSPEQNSWDILTKLEENIKNLNKSKENYESNYKSYKRAGALLHYFEKSREEVLDKLYSNIKERFIQFYRELHEIDEAEFDAILATAGAGIDFQVDFHGRGISPPHALHSEGHQDSMGICLYLALAERLTQGYIDLIILDDVMMSVDAPHRRQICHLLADFFKGRQFFITTHDPTWARQLQSEGVVTAKQRIELSNWTIEDGPYINYMSEIWDPIDNDLKRNDVPAAAAKLRRGSEEFFRWICNDLSVPVKFKDNGQYELGDLLPPAMNTYKKLLKEAKEAARDWGYMEEFDRLNELDKIRGKIFRRTNAENWAVNTNVHYNRWADFTINDFKPVVEAFKDLFSLFKCDNCEGRIHILLKGKTPELVRCNCGKVNWNLTKKN